MNWAIAPTSSCRTRAEWDWKPPYRLEYYIRERICDELLLVNRILHLIDGFGKRSYGATCSDLTVGNDEAFVNDIQNLFPVVRSGPTNHPMFGAMHGVGIGTHNNFMVVDEHCGLIDWIARQGAWLEAVTVLEAVNRRSLQF